MRYLAVVESELFAPKRFLGGMPKLRRRSVRTHAREPAADQTVCGRRISTPDMKPQDETFASIPHHARCPRCVKEIGFSGN